MKPDNVIALASVGIAIHHAGLNTDDRKAVEELYLRKALRVLVATSVWDFFYSHLLFSLSRRPWRLALICVSSVLPAMLTPHHHQAAQLVVIKGVKLYQNGEMREYSDLDIMQMMGRAVSLPLSIPWSDSSSRQFRGDLNLVRSFLSARIR